MPILDASALDEPAEVLAMIRAILASNRRICASTGSCLSSKSAQTGAVSAAEALPSPAQSAASAPRPEVRYRVDSPDGMVAAGKVHVAVWPEVDPKGGDISTR